MPYMQVFLNSRSIHFFLLVFGYAALVLYAVMLYQYQPDNPVQQSKRLQTKHVLVERPSTFSNLAKLFGTSQQSINLYKPTAWQLTGIIKQENGSPYVIIKSQNKEKIYFEGDKIDAYTVVEKIEKDLVIIRHQNKKKMITLFQSK